MIRNIAVFDFDGTLITKDSLIEFIKFSRGKFALYVGLIVFSPVIFLMKVKIIPNETAKEKLFSYFFKGISEEQFKSWGQAFSKVLEKNKHDRVVAIALQHINNGDKVYVISASIDSWIKPWCHSIGIDNIIGTNIEIKDGIVTGRFISRNCNGQEKVNRLLAVESDRQSYHLFAYGDSYGDKELLSFADEGFWINKKITQA